MSAAVTAQVETIARSGGTPLRACREPRGARNHPSQGHREARDRRTLRGAAQDGLPLAMITGDNPLTAAAIAAEAGVDDFLAQATPENKLDLIRQEQAGGKLVAMTGDGTNDAPALAQADVGVAMNSGDAGCQGGG